MKKRKILLCGIDFLIALCTYSALMLFCRGLLPGMILWAPENVGQQIFLVAAFSLLTVLGRIFAGIYRLIWRYPTVSTYMKIVIVDFCIAAFIVAVQLILSLEYFYINLAVFGCAFNCFATLISRFLYQWLYLIGCRRESSQGRGVKTNIAIVGAGSVGVELARMFLQNPKAHYYPVCFIDSDIRKANQSLIGLPIYLEDEKIIERIKSLPINEIIIALPEADGNKREQLHNLYCRTGCKVKIYDYSLTDPSVSASKTLRELSAEDFLFRDTIKIGEEKQQQFYRDKTVLITGGGGSIGSELCRQIAKAHVKKLIIFDVYENNAYDIQQELIDRYGHRLDLEVIIGSVRDAKRLDEVFAQMRPQIVIHAAAHKHVPLMERNACEAIKNNVFGTYNVANMAEKYGAEKFVLISTDKAVNPTNVMGATKRLCEMIVQCRQGGATKFVAVRFGNVLGSNGSVIPLFKRQIDKGGPITITDKRIIRYFMSIPEAVSLVLEAGMMARDGELFVLDMGQPVRIYDLAVNMIRLAGLIPDEDIKIEEIGLRPGEKLYEELLIESEQTVKTENAKIFIEKGAPLTREQIEEKLALLTKALEQADNDAIKSALKAVVPSFKEPDLLNS